MYAEIIDEEDGMEWMFDYFGLSFPVERLTLKNEKNEIGL